MNTTNTSPQTTAARKPAAPPTMAARAFRILGFLLLLGMGAYLLGYEISGEWSRQWGHEALFGDPYGPRGPLPTAANTTQNVVAGITGVIGVLLGTCGALYQLTAVRRTRRNER